MTSVPFRSGISITLTTPVTGALTIKANSDTNPRFTVTGDGVLQWGPGNAPLDTSLQRLVGNVLFNPGAYWGSSFFGIAGSPFSTVYAAQVSGDATPRFYFDANGQMAWGDGTNPHDVILGRAAPNVLALAAGDTLQQSTAPTSANDLTNKTYVDGQITTVNSNKVSKSGDSTTGEIIYTGSIATSGFGTRITGDTQDRVVIGNTGIGFGSGSAITDTNLYRVAADTLRTDDNFFAAITSASPRFLANQPAGNNNGYTVVNGASTQITSFQGLDLAGTSYGFFAVNKYFNGGVWVDTGFARPGASFQISQDSFTFFSFNTATTFTARLTVASGGNVAIGTNLSPAARLTFDASTTAAGGILFGADTNLYRVSANNLRTDSNFIAVGNITTAGQFAATRSTAMFVAFGSNITGDTVNRYQVTCAGVQSWGPGGATAVDTNLYRSSAARLMTDGRLTANTTGVAVGFDVKQTGDTQPRIQINTDSSIQFGPGGVTVADVSLTRVSATVLRCNQIMAATVGVGVGNSAAATTPGSVIRKMEVFDANGASLGFVPIYNTIT